jgi:ribulose kinase
MDTRDDIQIHQDHYIGIDVGTGSARACIIDAKGNIVGLASENIGLWQPQQGYYVRTSDWASDVFLTVA